MKEPSGSTQVNKCLSIKGAEDTINKPHAFEISTTEANMFFIADSDKVNVVNHFTGHPADAFHPYNLCLVFIP